jgi:hypothetical protein
MIICDVCKGRKTMVGLGNLTKDCPYCNGVGWIATPDQGLKVTLKDVMMQPKRKKKKIGNENVLQC